MMGNASSSAGITVAPMADIARARFVSNVASNASYIVLSTALMLWYIPFLVNHLGVAAYGMVALAMTMNKQTEAEEYVVGSLVAV